MSEAPIRMTAVEYRKMMGLDPVTSDRVTVRKIKDPDQKIWGDTVNFKLRKLILFIIWFLGWAWMLFTFGWVGHIATVLAKKGMKHEA